jgi:hypothetical protein
MVRKLAVVFALGAALVGAVGSQAQAETVKVGAYVAGPSVVVEVIPAAPGPDFIWVPFYHRWFPRAYYYGHRFERYRFYGRPGWRR